jgi:hypothetical protein
MHLQDKVSIGFDKSEVQRTGGELDTWAGADADGISSLRTL